MRNVKWNVLWLVIGGLIVFSLMQYCTPKPVTEVYNTVDTLTIIDSVPYPVYLDSARIDTFWRVRTDTIYRDITNNVIDTTDCNTERVYTTYHRDSLLKITVKTSARGYVTDVQVTYEAITPIVSIHEKDSIVIKEPLKPMLFAGATITTEKNIYINLSLVKNRYEYKFGIDPFSKGLMAGVAVKIK